jgi:hypothetical protein
LQAKPTYPFNSSGRNIKHAPGGEEMAGGSGNIFRDKTILIFRPDKGLAIIFVAIQRQQERGLLAVSERTGQ